MARRHYIDNAPTPTLTSSIDATQTTVPLSSLAGFPAQFPYTATINLGLADAETVLVTSSIGSTANVTRNYDGNGAFSHLSAATFQHVATAQDFDEANSHVNATTNVHGTTGGLVDQASTQSMSNKTLSNTSAQAVGGVVGLTVNTDGTTKALSVKNGATEVVAVTGTGALTAATVNTGGVLNTGTQVVNGNTTLGGALTVAGLASLNGALNVTGNVSLTSGSVTANGVATSGNASVGGALTISSNTSVGGALTVTGNYPGKQVFFQRFGAANAGTVTNPSDTAVWCNQSLAVVAVATRLRITASALITQSGADQTEVAIGINGGGRVTGARTFGSNSVTTVVTLNLAAGASISVQAYNTKQTGTGTSTMAGFADGSLFYVEVEQYIA